MPINGINVLFFSFPRAAINTARDLSKFMFEQKMISTLGSSIGWGGLLNSVNLDAFLNSNNRRNDSWFQ